jgi:uncharacterized protein (DUF2062 family)
MANQKYIRMKEWVVSRVETMKKEERCPRRLAFSCSAAVYVAFCPFIFFHTVIAFLIAWAFNLNFVLLIIISNFVNNPWTLVPVYSSGYFLGDRLFSWWGIDGIATNPAWVSSLNHLLASHVGLPAVSFWAFMLGGNLLGIGLAVILYPILKRFFEPLAHKK